MTKIPATTRIAVPPGTRALRIERYEGSWLVWVAANSSFTLGTYYQLHSNGLMECVTLRDDDTEDRFVVKPED